MKLFKQVNVDDEVVVINSYNREMTPKDIFIVSHIEPAGKSVGDGGELKFIIFRKDDPEEEFDFFANPYSPFVLHPWHRNCIIAPKEHFHYIQKIFNMGYLLGENNIRNNIKDILHI